MLLVLLLATGLLEVLSYRGHQLLWWAKDENGFSDWRNPQAYRGRLFVVVGPIDAKMTDRIAHDYWIATIVQEFQSKGLPTVTIYNILIWPFLVLLGMFTAIEFLCEIRNYRRVRRKRAGRCCNCGYDLRGSPSGRCPECGTKRSEE